MPKTLEGKRGLIPSELRNFASYDKARSTQYRETLYRYLTYNRSPKATCKALCTHGNTVLCRIRKIREDFGIVLDDPAGHTDPLLGMSLALFQPKAPTSSYSRGREEESKSTRKLKSHWVSRRKLAQIQQGTQAIIRLRPLESLSSSTSH